MKAGTGPLRGWIVMLCGELSHEIKRSEYLGAHFWINIHFGTSTTAPQGYLMMPRKRKHVQLFTFADENISAHTLMTDSIDFELRLCKNRNILYVFPNQNKC